MSKPYRLNASARTTVLLLVLFLGLPTPLSWTVQAQDGVPGVQLYTITGDVVGPDGALDGASVTLTAKDENVSEETTTASDGSFRFDGLLAGTYTVSVEHDCCHPARQEATVRGATLESHLSFRLRGSDVANMVTLTGRVIDRDTGAAVSGAMIQVSNSFSPHQDAADGSDLRCCYEGGYTSYSVVSGKDGAFVVDVHAGHVDLWVDADGYDYTRGSFAVETDRTLDIPVRAGSGDLVVISGIVRTDSGDPLQGAWVSVSPDYSHQCDGDVCIAQPEPSVYREPECSGDWCFDPRQHGYDSTQVDADGRFTLTTTATRVRLSASADRFLQSDTPYDLRDGQDREVTVTLRALPPEDVRVHGVVHDAQTGEPIPYAQVGLENQEWAHYNWTTADANGAFEFYTRPGYTILTASAYKHYWVPCEPTPLAEKRAADGADSAEIAIWPGPCSGQEREHEYFPVVHTVRLQAASSERFDAQLPRVPAPDAGFEGWVIDATTQEGVAGARVGFINEFTHEWGEAVTDADGSFRIPVRAGYYTVRAGADGFFDRVINVAIASGETGRLVLEMEPGEKTGYCCAYHARADAIAYAESGPAPSPPPAMASGDGDDAGIAKSVQQSSGAGGRDGQAAFEGGAGDLGPYRGQDQTVRTNDAAGVGVVLLLAAMAGAVLVMARRSKR